MRFTRAQDAIDHAKRRHNRMPTQVIRKPPQNLSAGSSNDGRTRIGQDESRSMESLKRQNAVRMKPPHSKPQIQFQCNRCHREFSTNSHLRKHQRESKRIGKAEKSSSDELSQIVPRACYVRKYSRIVISSRNIFWRADAMGRAPLVW
jgi:hypothetical protein